jgi:RHS repeat-associated protein
VENNLRFPGQYFDAETGLHQNYFRDYDPKTGRYIQADPIGLAGGVNPYIYVDSVGKPSPDLNLYAYTGNSPINYIDPYGLWRIGGSLGPVTFEWDSRKPYNTSVVFSTNLSIAAGVAFDFKNPINNNAPEIPFDISVGINKWLGVSTNNSDVTVKIGFGASLLPVDISKGKSCPN